jgi:multicomponent Na+:H+ antiporter subunit G
MTTLVAMVLAFGVASVWLGAAALLRLRPLGRLHAVSFVNGAAGGAVTLAAWLTDGATSRTGKALLVWVVLLLTGALSAHVTGRAIFLRGGERR